MTEPENRLTETDLDRMFQAVRAEPDVVPLALMDRIARDASREQALRSEPEPLPRPKPRSWRVPSLSAAVHRAMHLLLPVGLTASTLMGVWFGGWAMDNGLVSTDALLGSDLAFNLAYQLPALTDYLVGY
ncbi:hypothetical protein [Pseudoruegeria sp. SK021]|uniref:hypothetical protein n=1 Tax=Pseudoruegeria sp. SK021 TaxID=1933035 RepID=UPI000A2477E4|nr:hypothetical protein [Pseudoruegeria sp. SK021]OSP54309.1 hypothetical protein BV911_13120 [Pseudoruegeria sp. SK021]